LFIIKSSASNFPVIRWLAYESMVKEWNIVDANFVGGDVDRIYLTVTKNMDKSLRGILPEKDMSRF
jgi:hypothetical protein